MTVLLRSLAALALLLSQFSSKSLAQNSPRATDAYTLPALSSDEERLRLLLALKEEFPALLSNGVDYGFDPLAVLDDQVRLSTELLSDPSYIKEVQQRPSALDLRIQDKEARTIRETHVDPARIEAWRDSLKRIHELYPAPLDSLAKLTLTLRNQNATGELVKAIQSLSPDLRSEAFRQPSPEKKLQFLASRSEVPASIKEKIPEIQKLLKLELEHQRLSELAIVMQTEEGKFPDNRKLSEQLNRVGELELNRLQDYPHYVQPRLAALNTQLKGIDHTLAVKSSVVERALASSREHLKVSETQTRVVKRELHLSELRPAAAAFRGAAGGDCSTSCSFAAPNNPDELVFHLSDANKKTKGYVEATRLQVNGKPVLYVSSINGARISASDVDLILQGLHKSREAIGVSAVALPQQKQIAPLMNYVAITEKMKELTANQPEVEFTHKAPELRKKVESFESSHLTMDYDSMASNKRGVFYAPPEDSLIEQVEVRIQKKSLAPIRLPAEVDRAALIPFLIEIESSGDTSFADRAFKALNVNKEKYQDFKVALQNPSKKPMSVYEDEITERLRSLAGIEDPSVRIALDESLLLPGRLRASDAFSPANKQTSIARYSKSFAHPESEIRNMALEQLEKIENESLFREVSGLALKHGNVGIQIHAQGLQVQRSLGLDPSAMKNFVALVEANLGASNWPTRNAAIEALPLVSPPDESLRLFKLGLAAVFSDTQSSTSRQMIRVSDPALRTTLAELALNHRNWDVQVDGFGLLSTLPAGPEHTSLVVRAMELQDPLMTRKAMEELRRLPLGPTHSKLVKVAFREKDLAVQILATEQVLRISPAEPQLQKNLRDMLSRGIIHNDPEVRQTAIRYLERMGPHPSRVGLLRKALEDPEPEVKATAREVFESLKAKSGVRASAKQCSDLYSKVPIIPSR